MSAFKNIPFCVALLLLSVFCSLQSSCRDANSRADAPHPRIISYSPSVTDILVDLGLQDHLVGITSWCMVPSDTNIPVVGSETTVNTEALLSLRPDIVFIQQDPSRFAPLKKQRQDVKVISVKHDSVDGIYESIRTIGDAAGVNDRADRLASDIRKKLETLHRKYADTPRPRVLFVMGYDHPGTCGSDTYLDEIIEIAGGINAAAEQYKRWPTINAPMAMKLQPDVLICQANAANAKKARRYWMSLTDIPAVRNDRVYICTDRRTTIFGSRIADVAEQFANWIHAEGSR